MPEPCVMRGAFARLGFLAAIVTIFFAFAGQAHAAGRGWQEPVAIEIAATSRGSDALAEAARWIGSGNMTGYTEAWCRDFVNFVLRRTGHRLADDSHLAIAALRLGPHVVEPKPGDLAVMRHHVGFVEGVEPDGAIRLLSGNWGHRVARSVVPRGLVVAFVQVR